VKNSNNKAAFMGKVTASVTHEIQNVLAIIKETSGLMEDLFLLQNSGGLDDIENRLDSCIKTIKKQTYRGVNLTSGLNGFAHTADSSQTSINIFEIINKMIAITERLFKQKGVDVSIVECIKPYSIMIDPVFFQMVVFSCIECLIDNFGTKKPITLCIQSLDNRTAIQFLYNDDTLTYDDYNQKIIHSDQWEKITDLCRQISLSAEVAADSPALLVFFK
jgi:C4-dicarboxylate-specific signal transduction histidine kinase